MTCSGKIVTATPSDFAVRGGSLPYFGCSAVSEDPVVNCVIALFNGSVAVAEAKPLLATDYRLRNPVSLYSTRADLVPGDYRVVASVSSSTGAVQDSILVKIFDSASSVVTVANQGQLDTALQNIKNGSSLHNKIILTSGNYIYPTGNSYDLSQQDKLVSFEANGSVTFVGSNPYNIKWSNWFKVGFSNPAGTAFTSLVGSHHAFRRCSFYASATGVIASSGSYIRIEDCHAHTLTTGFVNVSVIRGLSWTKIAGVVFHNCSVIESTTGRRNLTTNLNTSILKRQCVWALFDGSLSGVVIRDNLVLDDYSTLILSDSNLTNLSFVGNNLKTTGKTSMQLGGLINSSVIHNTVVSDPDVPTIHMSGSSVRSLFINNYMTRLESPIRKIAETGSWVNNASQQSPKIGVGTILGDPKFQNNYRFLQVVSPLREFGVAVGGFSLIQGLPLTRQIGSMPYHVDTGLAHIYANMRNDSLFGFSLPPVVPS